VSGIQEILVVAVVILILFYLPKRTVARHKEQSTMAFRNLSGKIRLAIFASLIWLAVAAYLLQPWQKTFYPFIYFGFGPVALVWGVAWVIIGYRRQN